MFLGILNKIESTHNNLRTSSMEGVFFEFPNIGETFRIFGEGLYFGNRLIETTPVSEIIELSTDHIMFKTANSTYKVIKLKEIGNEQDYLKDSFKIPETSKDTQ